MKFCFFSRQTQSVITVPEFIIKRGFNLDIIATDVPTKYTVETKETDTAEEKEEIADFIFALNMYVKYWREDIEKPIRRIKVVGDLVIFYAANFSLEMHFSHNPELLNG